MKSPTLIASKDNLEVWSLFDPTAEVYELFAEPECECCVGCADTRTDALRIAREWLNED